VSETQVPRGTPWLGVAGLMLLATLLAAAFVQVRQHALLNQTVQDQDDFTVLSLYQLEVEYLRLREQLKLAALAPASGGHDELQLRYDIFLSRIDLLKAAKARRMLGTLASTQDTVRALEVFVSRAEVYLGRDPRAPLSQAAATALATESERLAEPIHQMLIDATHHVAAQITARRNDGVKRFAHGIKRTGADVAIDDAKSSKGELEAAFGTGRRNAFLVDGDGLAHCRPAGPPEMVRSVKGPSRRRGIQQEGRPESRGAPA